MSGIATVQFERGVPSAGGVRRDAALPGEIAGVETFHVRVPPRAAWNPAPEDGKLRVLFFLDGEGEIASSGFLGRFRNPALFVPPIEAPFSIGAGPKGFAALEALMALRDGERDAIRARGNPARFVSYADCATYREAIKSAKTVSRTLVAEDAFPRFCMGSVETAGPDQVAAHAHPMLEQLFLGLAGNRCFVRADDDEALLGEYVLLHVPRGSSHGVRVEAGDRLHYLWLDFFARQEDTRYITESHRTE